MDFHKLDAKGKIWIQRLATRPDPPVGARSHHFGDEGRIFYCIDEARFLMATALFYEPWGSDVFPLYTQCLFYQASAPTGWTIKSTATDSLVGIKGGTNAYNVNAGQIAGAWQQPAHNHSWSGSMSSSHRHSITHNHQWADYGSYGGATESTWQSDGTTKLALVWNYKSSNAIVLHVSGGDGYSRSADKYTKNASGNTDYGNASGTASGTTSSSATQTTWRPYAAVTILAQYDWSL